MSAIEDANQTIKFCGVGYQHQNAIVERKIQTITLLLHAKIYWPEEITTMLTCSIPRRPLHSNLYK